MMPFDCVPEQALTTDELAAPEPGVRPVRMRKSGQCPLFLFLLSGSLRASFANPFVNEEVLLLEQGIPAQGIPPHDSHHF
ncbi:hypothetical protein IE4872_CH00121 [Rhizobium gallicum]|uniref:Uncharacterized protein n=1 Tax=Rhizobium gallicum TaxID=56730 RepID=A0A1L5ND19_9HYPH|nr:hypothetical protein [Rhizobium gallicum]APO65794.1 hypothetical protein IE4872_CH00121 [Rhizobium gallicum]